MAQLIIGCAFLLLSLHDCDKKKSATYISAQFENLGELVKNTIFVA